MSADKNLSKTRQLDGHVKLAQRQRRVSTFHHWTESMRLQLIDIVLEVKREQPKRTAWEQVIARLAQLPASYGFEGILSKATNNHCFGHHRVVKYFQDLFSKYTAATMRTDCTRLPSLTEAVCQKLEEYRDLRNLEIEITKREKAKNEHLFPTLGPDHTCSPERVLRSSTKRSVLATRHLSKGQLHDHVKTVQLRRCKWTESMRLRLIDTMIEVTREQPRSTANIWERLITRLGQLPRSHGFKMVLQTANKGEFRNFGSHRVATQFRNLMETYKKTLSPLWRKECTRVSLLNPLTESVYKKLQEYSNLINGEIHSITSSKRCRSASGTSTSLESSKKFKSASDDDSYLSLQDGNSSKQPECYDDDQSALRSVTPKFNSRQSAVHRSTSSHSQRADDSSSKATQNTGSASSDRDITEGFQQNRLKESLLESVYDEFSQPSCKCKHELLSMGIQYVNKVAEEGLHDKRRKGLIDVQHPYKELEADYSFQLFKSKLRARHQDLQHKFVKECQKTTQEIALDVLEALHL